MTAGYSGTPLARKLGIREGDRVGTFGAPPGFRELVDLPPDARFVRSPRTPCRVNVIFATDVTRLEARFGAAMEAVPANGGIWVAWPKKSSVLMTSLSFDIVQQHGLDAGLVDNKVCAIDDDWSGLRFVVRKEDRPGWSTPAI
jgi:hypothetical protein